MSQPQGLPPDVIQALEKGQIIEAIKRLRSASGLGLAEAKHAVEGHMAGKPFEPAAPSLTPNADHADVKEALQRGNKIEAIRLMRERTGLGLKEAKDAVEAMQGRVAGYDPQALAPGQVPPSSSRFMLWVIAAAAAVIGYYLLR